MAYNEADKGIIGAFQKAGGRKAFVKKAIANATGKISDAAGAGPLVDYASSKIAKGMNSPDVAKHVDDRTSGKDALKSAGNLGLTVASIAGTGALAKGVASMGAKKAVAKKAISTSAGKVTKIPVKPTSGLDSTMIGSPVKKPWDGKLIFSGERKGNMRINFEKKRDLLKRKSANNRNKSSDIAVREDHGGYSGGKYSVDENQIMPEFSKSTEDRIKNSISRHMNKIEKVKNSPLRKFERNAGRAIKRYEKRRLINEWDS